jgi:hypothetical protein
MVYSSLREQVSIDGESNGQILDTDQCDAAATYIQWRVPGIGSLVAVTLSPCLGADLLDCQSLYIREKKETETRNETITLRTQLYKIISPTTYRSAEWRTFGGLAARQNCTSIGRWAKPMPAPFILGQNPITR